MRAIREGVREIVTEYGRAVAAQAGVATLHHPRRMLDTVLERRAIRLTRVAPVAQRHELFFRPWCRHLRRRIRLHVQGAALRTEAPAVGGTVDPKVARDFGAEIRLVIERPCRTDQQR